MRYKLLGKSGLRVSEMCLGTMSIGEDWGWGADLAESRKIFETFATAGGNFVDTANKYTNGTSEKYTGEIVNLEREWWVVATKYTLSMRDDDPNASGNHRKNMVQAVDASLKRLNLDYIDLLWVHAWDRHTPVEETMRALDDLVRSGKVLYIGVSDTPAWVVSRANTLAELRGWTSFVGLQIEYSLIQRTVERALTPMAEALDLAVLAWAPLGGGLLTGKYRKDNPKAEGTDSKRAGNNAFRAANKKNMEIVEKLCKIADKIGCTPAQLAMRWVADRPGVTIPLVGARTEAQIKDSLGYLDVTLDPKLAKQLDDVSAVELGFPHDFLRNPEIMKVVYGANFDKIDDHRDR
ncbi:MAG: aldo/keto reductase [Deltaproteobacteria bacterium]|nr:aldo/keto reductase [Deltaproteobacteria bacterium]